MTLVGTAAKTEAGLELGFRPYAPPVGETTKVGFKATSSDGGLLSGQANLCGNVVFVNPEWGIQKSGSLTVAYLGGVASVGLQAEKPGIEGIYGAVETCMDALRYCRERADAVHGYFDQFFGGLVGYSRLVAGAARRGRIYALVGVPQATPDGLPDVVLGPSHKRLSDVMKVLEASVAKGDRNDIRLMHVMSGDNASLAGKELFSKAVGLVQSDLTNEQRQEIDNILESWGK